MKREQKQTKQNIRARGGGGGRLLQSTTGRAGTVAAMKDDDGADVFSREEESTHREAKALFCSQHKSSMPTHSLVPHPKEWTMFPSTSVRKHALTVHIQRMDCVPINPA